MWSPKSQMADHKTHSKMQVCPEGYANIHNDGHQIT